MLYKIKNIFTNKNAFDKPNIIDRLLEKTILRGIPMFIKPNHVTIFRYITIPFIVYLLIAKFNIIALVLFSISAFTDMLDGALARTRNSITEWGKLHDPIADKLLIGIVGAYLITQFISVIIIVTLIFIELLIIFSALHRRDKKKEIVGALLPGKIKMVLQSLSLIIILFYSIFLFSPLIIIAEIILYLAIFFALISLFVYRSL